MAVKLPGDAQQLPVARSSGIMVQPGQDVLSPAVAKLGKNITSAGENVADVFIAEEKRINKVRTEDAFTQLRNKQIDLTIGQEDGFKNLKSGDAVKTPVLKDWTAKFDGAVQEIAGGLSNDAQKKAFQQRAEVAKSQFTQDILQHQYTQNGVYQTQVMDSTVEAEKNAAAMHWNSPTDAMASLERVKRAVDDYAAANGLTGKVKEAELQKRESQVHLQVITEAMDNGNPEYADLWFKTHRKGMTADAAVKAEKLMKENGTRLKAQNAVDSIMTNNWPEEKAVEHARSKYKGEERDDIIKRIKDRYSEANQLITQQHKQAQDNAWKIVVQPNSTLDSIPPSLWSSMTGEGQKQITDYLRARATKAERKEDDWDMLDQAEHHINVGDIIT